jgi:hypothetical protein
MTKQGREQLYASLPDYRGAGRYPIAAYSEFMPAPRVGWRPYSAAPADPSASSDPFAWQVSEREEIFELQPGLQHVAGQVLHALQHLDREQPAQGIGREKLAGNPYWPRELAELPGAVPHERYVVFLPLALSQTKDDKGRVRWTFFGGSEQGPDRAFWKSFYRAPGQPRPAEYAVDFIRRLLHAAYAETPERLADLRGAGFRILPGSGEAACELWKQDPLPDWTKPFLLSAREPLANVKYLLTFRPFGSLPPAIRKAYLSGTLHLLPFPGSLVFWGCPPYLKLQRELPWAMQIPLLSVCDRREAPQGLRIPQCGWLHEPHPDLPEPDLDKGKLRNTYHRTHRWARIGRDENELSVAGREDSMAHVLFSAEPDDVGLYGKPMARNAQIWTYRYELLLDGPRADREQLSRAATALRGGGQFGYRLHFPPIQAGRYDVLWQRPLVAFADAKTGEARVLADAPGGYFTAYRSDKPDLARPVELWPDVQQRPEYMALADGYRQPYAHENHQFALNAHKLIEAADQLDGQTLPPSFARQILHIPKDKTLDQWVDQAGEWGHRNGCGSLLDRTLRRIISPPGDPSLQPLPEPLTFHRTATRAFEVAYWRTIRELSAGRFLNKDNADCVDDPPSEKLRKHAQRDLQALGDHLLAYYRRIIAEHEMCGKGGCGKGGRHLLCEAPEGPFRQKVPATFSAAGKAIAGDLPFSWQTDFEFPWMGGWHANQPAQEEERDLLVVIPGRDRRRAVIMADHYDTAYMEDLYYESKGGKLARVAAAGADDNHSATAALMLGAPVFLELSRAGKLDCDVWLVHLTGEEFPSDCMGARHLAQWLVEGTLRLRHSGRTPLNLSGVRVEGVYVLDMVAHNREHDRDVFQISPGVGRQSLALAYQAHLANRIWNACSEQWNQRPPRRRADRGRRSADGKTIPAVARHPRLDGEVRTPRDPRSSLYNTDGQIFSDAGIPVVLFMENYDINRTGYHDTKDTMANIDLDYGAAVAAIAIESVARVAQGISTR